MIVNPELKKLFKDIADKSVTYINEPDKERKYLIRLLKVFNSDLTENEKLYVFKLIIEQIHYRNIITDPDNIAQIHNVKLKTISFVFFLSVAGMLIAAILFKTNDSLNNILEIFSHIAKLLTL